jgi:hypothetical protein
MAPTQQTLAILASLQTDVLNAQKSKIDFSDTTDKPNMDTLKQQLWNYSVDVNNHTPEGLEIFKDFEKIVADTRRTLAASVSKLEKEKKKLKREADKKAAKDLAKAKSEADAAERQRNKEIKQKQKTVLAKINKILKPTISSRKKLLKWGMVGARANLAAHKKLVRKEERDQERRNKEQAAEERKIVNAGKPKNGAFAKFCKWLPRPDEETLINSGCEHKRDYNKKKWEFGFHPYTASQTNMSWEDYRKSSEAPWMID